MLDGFQTEPFRRGGPAAVFSFEADGSPGAEVVMTVYHRDENNPGWSEVGAISAFVPACAAVKVAHLRQELRLRFSMQSHGSARVWLLPPEWLPC